MMKKEAWMLLSGFMLTTFPVWAQPVHFTDESDKLRFVTGTMGQAKCAADMNGDLLDDVTRVASDGIHIDFQQADGTFRHQFFPLALKVLPTWSICAGDLNGDGYNDLLFAGGGAVSFALATENGTAYVETQMPAPIFSQRSTLFDIDADGDLDAFVCHDSGPSQAFRNAGDGVMSLDPMLLPTSSLPGNYSAIWTDYDNDGYTDLYISKCLANAMPGNPARTNLLYHNNGNGTFTEKGAEAGLNDNAQSWSTVFEDFDNDGDFDAFIVNHDQGNRLMRNNGDGTFNNVIATSGIDEFDFGAWENAAGDFNNDGWVDIISELKNELYLGNGDLTFSGQSLQFTPGAIGDFNDDGFLDLTYRSRLWVNDGNSNHWLKLQLRGAASNRNGVGARVEIYGDWGMQVRELRSGQSFSPMNTLSVHFGLGQSTAIDKLRVLWPSGNVTEVSDLQIDTTYIIPEATCVLSAQSLEVFGKTEICPLDTVLLKAPEGYVGYLWSEGSASSQLWVTKPGRYDVIYTDTSGCAGLSPAVNITQADAVAPIILVQGTETLVCAGVPVTLLSSAGANTDWSNGVQDEAVILVDTSGTYTASVDSVCATGKLVSAPVEIVFLPAPAPTATSAILMPGDSMLLSASGQDCFWYDQALGGQVLANTCDFQTSALFSDTVFYVESRFTYPGDIQSGGKPDSIGYSPAVASNKKMHFSAWEPFTLLSCDLYVSAQQPEGFRTIRLGTDTMVIADTTLWLSHGKNTVALGFKTPVGHHTLECDLPDQRQLVGALDFPYPIGDVGQLDSSSAGMNFYPYFFNWNIQKQERRCISARTPVSVQLTGNVDLEQLSGLELFPVPTSNMLNIRQSDAVDAEVVVLDGLGRQRFRQYFQADKSISIDTEQWSPGIYRALVITRRGLNSAGFTVVR